MLTLFLSLLPKLPFLLITRYLLLATLRISPFFFLKKLSMIIGIVGHGLIGGSLALDLKKQGHHVLGVSHRDSTTQRAISLGIVSQASVNMS